MENEKKDGMPSMMSMFPAEELKRMILHIDRFDKDVITEERMNAERALDSLEEVSNRIIEENI